MYYKITTWSTTKQKAFNAHAQSFPKRNGTKEKAKQDFFDSIKNESNKVSDK